MNSTAQLYRLDGRIAFISAARGHLGRVMTHALCDAGAHVIVNGRDADALTAFANGLRDEGRSVEPAAFDVADIASVREFFSRRPRLDIVVNNAISMTPRTIDALTPAHFDETFRSAVVSAFEIVRAARPALRAAVAEAGEASVINIASMYAAVAPDARLYADPSKASPFHYGPAKAALLQLTRHLAAELGPEGIRVNALVPGPFPHDRTVEDRPFVARLAERTMLGRTGRAEEIAGPLLFLAAKASSFVTGSSFAVDGGWTAW